ncbi:hypothetical protein GCM10009661_35040 [Catellatospora chokoriensis]
MVGGVGGSLGGAATGTWAASGISARARAPKAFIGSVGSGRVGGRSGRGWSGCSSVTPAP